MVEFCTRYPKTVYVQGQKEKIFVDSKNGVEQLTLVVKKSVEDLLRILSNEGFTKIKFEHKHPFQIGSGMSLKLSRPWELHVRLLDMKKGLVGIQAEIEVSRDYLQHLFCQRTPVTYEIEKLLRKHQIQYKLWNERIKKYVQTVFDNYVIKLITPSFPVFAWKPMLYVISTVGVLYLWKYLNTI